MRLQDEIHFKVHNDVLSKTCTYSSQPPRWSEQGLSETALIGGVYGRTDMAQYRECPRVPVEQVGTGTS